MRTTCKLAFVLAGVFLAGCAGVQPASPGPAQGNQVAHPESPLHIYGRSASGAELKAFPTLDPALLAVAQFGVYRVEFEADHKAYLSCSTGDRVYISDFSKELAFLSMMKSAATTAIHASNPKLSGAESDLVDLYLPWAAIGALPQLLISNMQSGDPIPALVDLAKEWASKGSITWRTRTTKLAEFDDAQLSAETRDRLQREIEEYSKRDGISQTQSAR